MLKKYLSFAAVFVLSLGCFGSFSFADSNFDDNIDILANAYIDMKKARFDKSSFNYTDETLKNGMIEFENGVLGGKIDDFDNDSQEELLTFEIEQGGTPTEKPDSYGRKRTSGKVTAKMYEVVNGNAVKTDEFITYEFLDSDLGEYEFFIKTVGNKKYVAVQNMSYSGWSGDGVVFDIQIYGYNGSGFENKFSMRAKGSAFDFNKYYLREINKLKDMGFSDAVNQMIEGYIVVNLTKYDEHIEKVTEVLVSTNSGKLGEVYGYSNLEKTVKEHGTVNVFINNYTDIDGMPSVLKTISVVLNGEELLFEQPPYIENGITMVPMRAIFEALGASINFDPRTKAITSVKNGKTVVLNIGSDVAFIDSGSKNIGVRVKSLNGVAMVPLRFISEAFGAKVEYNGIERIITITN